MTSTSAKDSIIQTQNTSTRTTLFSNSSDLRSFSKICVRDDKPTGFHNLPVSVLMTIFQYFDEDELRSTIIPVCHKWRQVALLPDLWRKLKFKGLHVPQNFICLQLRRLQDLQCLYLINIPNATAVIRQLCRCNPRLVAIAIKNCKDQMQERLPERVLRNLVASCRKLQEINLKGTPFYGNLFYLEVAVLPELKSINLSNNEYLNTKNLFELVLNCRNLEELKLSYRNNNQQLSDNDATFLFSNLKATLRSLTFDTMGLSDIAYKVVLGCKKLEKLYLYNTTNMSPETFNSIWKKLPELKYLKIHNSQVNSTHFIKVFTEGKSVMRNLKILNISGTWKLTTEGLKAMAECCTELEKVVFKGCKNIDNIDCVLDNCKKLRTLNIAFCPKITNETILEIPVKLALLETLYSDNDRKPVLQQLKNIYPKLDIYICLSEYNKTTQLLYK